MGELRTNRYTRAQIGVDGCLRFFRDLLGEADKAAPVASQMKKMKLERIGRRDATSLPEHPLVAGDHGPGSFGKELSVHGDPLRHSRRKRSWPAMNVRVSIIRQRPGAAADARSVWFASLLTKELGKESPVGRFSISEDSFVTMPSHLVSRSIATPGKPHARIDMAQIHNLKMLG